MNANKAREIADGVVLTADEEYFNRVVIGMIRNSAAKGRYSVLTSKIDIIKDSYIDRLHHMGYEVYTTKNEGFKQYNIDWSPK